MESQSQRVPQWESFVARNDNELGRLVGAELVERLIIHSCSPLVANLMLWLKPMIGEQNAFLLEGDLFNLLVKVSDVSANAGIAVERTRQLAERDPRLTSDSGPDCERWLRLALAESGLEPYSPKSLIPSEPTNQTNHE